MIIDANRLASDTIVSCRVCIIGGGPAGISVLHELARAGLDVCLVESGGFQPEPSTQALGSGPNRGRPYYPLKKARARALGGSSHLWFADLGLRSRPLDESDFERRDWIPNSGWPFARETLEHYYSDAGKLCGLASPDYEIDPGSDASAFFPDQTLIRPVAFRFAPTGRFREMASKDSHLPNARILLNANVLGLDASTAPNRIDSVRVGTLSGKRFTVAASTYVLAAGGIENARLLLLSNSRFPAGLGNQHGLVGRYFMEHPHVLGGHITPEGSRFSPPFLFRPAPPNNATPLGAVALSRNIQEREGIGNLCAFLHTTDGASTFRSVRSARALKEMALHGLWDRTALSHVRNVLSGPRGLIRFARGRLRPNGRDSGLTELLIMSEQTPNPASRVGLTDKRDAFGQHRVALDWRLSDQDLHTIRAGQRIIDTALQSSGQGRLYAMFEEDSPPISGGWHHMGTTRMSDAESQGVVDSDARVHGTANLFVAGSSVFPTVGYANPTLTLVALAIKLAGHLVRLESAARVATGAGTKDAGALTGSNQRRREVSS